MPLSPFFHRMLSFPLASWLYLATPFSPPRPLLPVFILILLLRHPVSFVLSTLLFVPFLHLLLYRFLSSSVCPFKLRSFFFLIVAARIPFLSSTGPPSPLALFLFSLPYLIHPLRVALFFPCFRLILPNSSSSLLPLHSSSDFIFFPGFLLFSLLQPIASRLAFLARRAACRLFSFQAISSSSRTFAIFDSCLPTIFFATWFLPLLSCLHRYTVAAHGSGSRRISRHATCTIRRLCFTVLFLLFVSLRYSSMTLSSIFFFLEKRRNNLRAVVSFEF